MVTFRFPAILFGALLFLHAYSSLVHAQIPIWANDGGDKVTRDELRAANDAASVVNRVWDGRKITVFAARNEVVSFNVIIEAPTAAVANATVSFDRLTGPGGEEISSRAVAGNGVFDWTGRNIELFYVRYLAIKGLSLLCYNALYDERHTPERFRRPYTGEGEGEGEGAWEDRPDHDKQYPDIAVPLELEHPFNIAAGQNQGVWVDIYVPASAAAGLYQGVVTVGREGAADQTIPVELTVRNFSLPDIPSARTMLYYSPGNINYRYLSASYIDPSSEQHRQSIALIDLHFQLAHRHKISLIDETIDIERMGDGWVDRLNGDLFTRDRGYDGPGAATGNNVFSIGTYSSWTYAWSDASQADMWSNTDAWVNWFDARAFTTPTEYFLYLIDESDDFPQTEQWARWMDANPGPGGRLMSMATISSPADWENNTPSLDIPTPQIDMGITDLWENATQRLVSDPDKRFYYYNGIRPASGSFCTEDDGVALRVNGWIQHKKKIDRWFYWESTYYDNYQAGLGQTDVFNRAQTYGDFDGVDLEYARGESGWNYTNGDGVLFYPGSDAHFPQSSYGASGPFASLRLKHWRRGVQDADYLALAAAVDASATAAIVERMIPKALWDYGVESEEDPTYVYTDISWSTDPDDWEAARKELADIIDSASPNGANPIPDVKANGSDGPIVIAAGAPLTLSIALNAQDHIGEAATWWILQSSPSGRIYYYDLLQGGMAEGLSPTWQGGLLTIPDIPLPTFTDPAIGVHTFYFAILFSGAADSPNAGQVFYDSVEIEATRP